MNERELANLKAELEMVDYEEFEELRKRVETLEDKLRQATARQAVLAFKFNELIDMLYATNRVDKTFLYCKIKEVTE